MKSIIFCILFLTAISTAAQVQVNSVKNISTTLETFAKAFEASDEFPSIFIQTKEEQRTMLRDAKRDFDESVFDDRYEKKITRLKARFKDIKKDLGKIERRISWDTISYITVRQKVIAVTILFSTLDRIDNESREKRVFCELVVLGDRLFPDGRFGTVSQLDYDFHVLENINNEREVKLDQQYRNYLFTSSENNVVPFQQKGKWGILIDVDDSNTQCLGIKK